MPALAAWTAFLLCRYLTRAFIADDLWLRRAGGNVAPSPPDAFVSNPDIADITNFGTRSEQEVGPPATLVHEKRVDVVFVYRFRGTKPAGCA